MMWRMFNKMFGWDYVSIESVVLNYKYLRRVHEAKDGSIYVYFTSGNIWFLGDDGKVGELYTWIPLT